MLGKGKYVLFVSLSILKLAPSGKNVFACYYFII